MFVKTTVCRKMKFGKESDRGFQTLLKDVSLKVSRQNVHCLLVIEEILTIISTKLANQIDLAEFLTKKLNIIGDEAITTCHVVAKNNPMNFGE